MNDDEKDFLAMEFHRSGNLGDPGQEPPQAGIGSNSGEEPDDALDDMDIMDLLREGRKALVVDLVRLIRSGQATPAEKAVLAKLLKDNGVILGDPEEGGGPGSNPKAAKQPRELPTFEKPDYDR